MTPLQLEILLWYMTRTEDFRDLTALAVRGAVDALKGAQGMLQLQAPAGGADHRTYELTEKAEVFMAHILSTPLPRCVWRIERGLTE